MKGQITLQEWMKPAAIQHCEHFVKYKGLQVKECLKANIAVFQDGYIDCSLIEGIECEQCYKELEEKMKQEEQEDE